MSFEKITGEDQRLHDAIDATYADLQERYEEFHPVPLLPCMVAQDRYCMSASSIVTKYLLEQGIVAAREAGPYHLLTSLEEPTTPLSEDDLVVCLTWGQFSDRFDDVMQTDALVKPPAYIGRRGDIIRCIKKAKYYQAYCPSVIRYRQYTFAEHPAGHIVWLRSRPDMFDHETVPLGRIDYDEYPPEIWE